MARSTKAAAPQRAKLTPEEMRKAIERLQRRIDELKAFEPEKLSSHDEVEEACSRYETSIQDTLVRTFGADTVEAQLYSKAGFFRRWSLNMWEATPLHEMREAVVAARRESLTLLAQAIRSLEEQIAEAEPRVARSALKSHSGPATNRKVFVVHGHDNAARVEVARVLEAGGFAAIILNEQPNRGQSIIEKIEANDDVGFAVVLLTPDDEGARKGETPQSRARQNVIFELGYFIKGLGRDRVCVLRKGEIEFPSDYLGVVFVELDAAGAWKAALAKELDAAGFEVDFRRML